MNVSQLSRCDVAKIPTPTLFGAEILDVAVNVVNNYTYPILEGWRYTQPSEPVAGVDFCNITVTYSHPGHNDTINVEAWLPFSDWNGILQAVGGGGWAAGRFVLSYAGMIGAVADGYATVSTDAGLDPNAQYTSWILQNSGSLDLYALENFGHVSLHDQAILVKQIINDFYGRPAAYSYWNGCSNGGRQAATHAQRYPHDYDGIIAAAPALPWAELIINTIWGGVYMDLTKQYPRGCELDALTALGVSECDELDGFKDGLIADTEACRAAFDPFEHVGSTFNCSDTGKTMEVSRAAAAVANALWTGPTTSNGDFIWYGYEIGADLKTLAPTVCENDTCSGSGIQGLTALYDLFVKKDPSANSTGLGREDFDFLAVTLKKTFASSVEANITDLSAFRNAGGKMLTYHGLADPSIPPRGSLNYYQAVTQQIDFASDFYRYFEVPGLGHCWGGNGGQPTTMFDQLRAWVENGTAPSQSPVTVTLPSNATQEEILCAWPTRPSFDVMCEAGDRTCWSCVG